MTPGRAVELEVFILNVPMMRLLSGYHLLPKIVLLTICIVTQARALQNPPALTNISGLPLKEGYALFLFKKNKIKIREWAGS